MTTKDYLEKFPVIEKLDDFSKNSTLVALMTLDRLVMNHYVAYNAIIEPQFSLPGTMLSYETYQKLAGYFELFRKDEELRYALEILTVLWNYTTSEAGHAHLLEMPDLDIEKDLTNRGALRLIGDVVDESSLPEKVRNIVEHVLEHGFDASGVAWGELPPAAAANLSKLTATEKAVSFADSLLGAAGFGPSNGYGSVTLDDSLANRLSLIFYYEDRGNPIQLFYEVYAKKIQQRGFNHRISLAAARLGLMMDSSDEEMVAIAMYLLRTYPAYDSLISELSLIRYPDEFPANLPKVALAPYGGASFLQSVKERLKMDNLMTSIDDILEEALPVIQYRLQAARLEIQGSEDTSHQFYCVRLTNEAIYARLHEISLTLT